MPFLDGEIITLRDGASFAVYEAHGQPVVATRVADPFLPLGLAAFCVGYDRSGEPAALHKGMPVEIVRDFCRAHGGVESGGETALAILRRMPPATPPAPPPVFALPNRPPPPTGRGSRAAKADAQRAAYHAAVSNARPKWVPFPMVKSAGTATATEPDPIENSA